VECHPVRCQKHRARQHQYENPVGLTPGGGPLDSEPFEPHYIKRNQSYGELPVRRIHDFLWGEFCDWYIEFAKIRLRQGSAVLSPIPVLGHVLDSSLRLLHPYMPFVTEELWQHLKNQLPSEWAKTESIMVASYPTANDKVIDPLAERVIESVIDIIRSIRNTRAQYKVESQRWIEAQIYSSQLASAIIPYSQAIQSLAHAKPLTFPVSKQEPPVQGNALAIVLKESEVIIPMESMVDLKTKSKRLHAEIDQVQAEVNRLEARLNNKDFLTKAPTAIIDKERQKLYSLSDKLERLKQQLINL